MVMGAKASGGIRSTEASMVEGALDLVDMKIASIMVPRINVVALEVLFYIQTLNTQSLTSYIN